MWSTLTEWSWLTDTNKDFANYWIAARLVMSGQVADLFADHASYFRHMTAAFGADYPWHNWSYPPHYLLLIWPLAWLSYPFALAVFLLTTLGCYLFTLRAFLRDGQSGRNSLLLLLLLLPFVLHNIDAAQNGFLTGALLLGGLAARGSRPILAGLLFGILTVKPQLGIMLPFLLLIERQWQVIIATIVTTLALVLLSAALFGAESWQGYLTATLPYQKEVMTSFTGLFIAMQPSLFVIGRLAGLTPEMALWLHMLVAVPVVIAALVAIWRAESPGLRAAVAILATYVLAPYWLTYDFGAATAAIILLAGRTKALHARGATLVLLIAAFLPVLSVPLVRAGLLVAPWPVFGALFIAMWLSFRPGRALA